MEEDVDVFTRGVNEMVAAFHDRGKEGLTLGTL
jgi:hypothetical protein